MNLIHIMVELILGHCHLLWVSNPYWLESSSNLTQVGQILTYFTSHFPQCQFYIICFHNSYDTWFRGFWYTPWASWHSFCCSRNVILLTRFWCISNSLVSVLIDFSLYTDDIIDFLYTNYQLGPRRGKLLKSWVIWASGTEYYYLRGCPVVCLCLYPGLWMFISVLMI